MKHAEAKVVLSIEGVTVLERTVTIPVPPAGVKLADDALEAMVRQAAVKLLPGVSLADPAPLRDLLEKLAHE